MGFVTVLFSAPMKTTEKYESVPQPPHDMLSVVHFISLFDIAQCSLKYRQRCPISYKYIGCPSESLHRQHRLRMSRNKNVTYIFSAVFHTAWASIVTYCRYKTGFLLFHLNINCALRRANRNADLRPICILYGVPVRTLWLFPRKR